MKISYLLSFVLTATMAASAGAQSHRSGGSSSSHSSGGSSPSHSSYSNHSSAPSHESAPRSSGPTHESSNRSTYSPRSSETSRSHESTRTTPAHTTPATPSTPSRPATPASHDNSTGDRGHDRGGIFSRRGNTNANTNTNTNPNTNTNVNRGNGPRTESGRTTVSHTEVPQRMANKVPQGATIEKHGRDGGYTVRDPKSNTTKVYDADGKQRASFNHNTGTTVYTPKRGGTTVTKTVNGHQITERSAPGYHERLDRSTGVREISYRGTNIKQSAVVNNRYSRTVVVNNVTIYNRTYVRVYNNYGYYGVYEPVWWGNPYGWYAYQPFYTTYWGPVGFVVWSRPLIWQPVYWGSYYGYGWYNYSYYPYYTVYFTPYDTYPSLGWWLADYYIAREIENDRLAREAARLEAERDAAVAQEELEFDRANAAALNNVSAPLDRETRGYIAKQTEEVVSAIKFHRQLLASDLMVKGHLFIVSEAITSNTVVGDQELQCKVTAGDVLMKDPRVEPETVNDLDENGNVRYDENGRPMTITYVTMLVKASKKGSCSPGLNVTVQMSALQDMVNEEMATVEKGMEDAVNRHLNP